jgi:hypothetical protein
VQDGTSDGRYRLLECIGRNDKGETWRAFDNVTQREVAVTVLADAGGDTVTVLADDGGDTVAKELPQWAAGSAPALDYPATGSGYVFEYPAYSPIGSTPAGLPPPSRRRRTIRCRRPRRNLANAGSLFCRAPRSSPRSS